VVKVKPSCGCCDNEIEIIDDVVTVDDNCCVDEVGEMVQKLVRVFQLFERDQIKIHGFTTTQCYTLIEIYKSGSFSMSELSDKMNLNTSTMTRILDNLVRDRYVSREKEESDRRIVVIRLTEKGKEAALKLSNTVNDYYKKIIQNIPGGQVDDILNSVGILLNAFERANPNCC
jgi:MarR family transcriptional regulator, organic hydroperoxide resistance regulator